MFKTIPVAAALLCMVSYAAGGTRSIGTASARGDLRVDSYTVNGNATLFDGSVVETGQASADLRLGKGVEITMASDSRGTLYQNRLVLQQGASELEASGPFELQAYGLRVTPNRPNSRGLVSLQAGNTVEVSALAGGFGVTDDHGVMLASVHPGSALSFAIQAGGGSMAANGSSSEFSDVGMVSYQDGHYYLTDESGAKYEMSGNDLKKYVGYKVVVSGTEVGGAQPGGISGMISINKIAVNGPGGYMSTRKKVVISSLIVGAGIGASIGLNEANQTATPASR